MVSGQNRKLNMSRNVNQTMDVKDHGMTNRYVHRTPDMLFKLIANTEPGATVAVRDAKLSTAKCGQLWQFSDPRQIFGP